MLNFNERRQVLGFFRSCSILCLLPIRVDVGSWEVWAGTGTKWRAWICKGSYALFIAHTSYKVTTLLYTLIFCPHAPLHQMLIHGHVVGAAVMLVYWYYLLYIEHAHVNAAFVRLTLTADVVRGKQMQLQ